MTRTQLYLPESQHEELKMIAIQRKQTFASVVREIIEEKLAEIKKKERISQPKNQIAELLKSLKQIEKYKDKKGVRDGSTRLDYYLYHNRKCFNENLL